MQCNRGWLGTQQPGYSFFMSTIAIPFLQGSCVQSNIATLNMDILEWSECVRSWFKSSYPICTKYSPVSTHQHAHLVNSRHGEQFYNMHKYTGSRDSFSIHIISYSWLPSTQAKVGYLSYLANISWWCANVI